MEEGAKKSNALPMIFGFLVVIAFGAGGYFLGQYLDTIELEKQAEADAAADNTPQELYYESTSLGIRFDLPSDSWEVSEESEDSDDYDTITSIGAIGTSGSAFFYTFYEERGDLEGSQYTCYADDPDGDIPGNSACEFVEEGDVKFARLLDDETAEGDVWIVAEYDETTDRYFAYPYDEFSYFVTSDSDLDTLDNIMLSVER